MNPTRSELGFRRWAAMLFDQQMWCLGRGIVRTHGNILLHLGMCQYRSPDPNRGSTLYTAAVEPGGSLFLWGFGAMYTEPGLGGIFIRRYRFAPKLMVRESAVGVHEVGDLGQLITPVNGRERQKFQVLLPRFVGWFAKYEHWIAETFGTQYREECLTCRPKSSIVAAKDMAKEWESVAKRVVRRPLGVETAPIAWRGLLSRLRLELQSRPVSPADRPSTRVVN